MDQCKTDLANQLYCIIPEIILPDALDVMSEQAIQLQSISNHKNSLINCYLHRQIDTSIPEDHARNLQDRSSVRMITYDQIPDTSRLKLLYHSDLIREMVTSIAVDKK